jgi:predicted RNA-binding protein associated with RNAse of E/G family
LRAFWGLTVADVTSPEVALCLYKVAARIETDRLGLVEGMAGAVIRVLDHTSQEDVIFAGLHLTLLRYVGSGNFFLGSKGRWNVSCVPDYGKQYDFRVKHDRNPEPHELYTITLETDGSCFEDDLAVMMAHV